MEFKDCENCINYYFKNVYKKSLLTQCYTNLGCISSSTYDTSENEKLFICTLKIIINVNNISR